MDAGENIEIISEEQALTIVLGNATDPDEDDLRFRWLESTTVLQDWEDVGATGEAHLDLGTVPSLDIGQHTLTLDFTSLNVSIGLKS